MSSTFGFVRRFLFFPPSTPCSIPKHFTHDDIISLRSLLSVSLPVRPAVALDVSMDRAKGMNPPVRLDVDIPTCSSLSTSWRSSTVSTMEEFPVEKTNERNESELDEGGGREGEGIEKLNELEGDRAVSSRSTSKRDVQVVEKVSSLC